MALQVRGVEAWAGVWAGGAGLVLAAGLATAQPAPPFWRAERLGLVGADYQASTGQRFTNVLGQTSGAEPVVWGVSTRFNEIDFPTGSAAWVRLRSGAVQRIGFFTGRYNSSVNVQNSELGAALGGGGRPNARGEILGYSEQYQGLEPIGRSAWVWSEAAGTARVAPADAAFRNEDGFEFVMPEYLNDAGDIAGYGYRYDAANTPDENPSVGVWQRRAGGGVELTGLLDADHRRNFDNYQFHQLFGQNAAGVVTGASARFGLSGEDIGRSGWIARPGQPVLRVALDGPPFVNAQGQSDTGTTVRVLDNGWVFGGATRYSLVDELGSIAFAYAPGTNTPILLGLFDAEHTSATDLQKHLAIGATASPLQIFGISERYNPTPGTTIDGGSSGWVWTPGGGYRVLGLTDAEHTSTATNTRTSFVFAAATDNIAYGVSGRFDASGVPLGSTYFVAGPGTQPVRRVGLFDPIHVSSEGIYRIEPRFISPDGKLYGVSYRYNGRSDFDFSTGRTAWVFDPRTNVTTELTFSTATNGDAVTDIAGVTEDGEVYGVYYTYEGNALVNRSPFVWSPVTGLFQANALLEGGPASIGATTLRILANIDVRNGAGVAFIELPTEENWVPYLLTRNAPECGSADFDGDGDVGTDADIEAFFSCLAGNCCASCQTADFNVDGDTGTDADIEAFFRVLAGGSC